MTKIYFLFNTIKNHFAREVSLIYLHDSDRHVYLKFFQINGFDSQGEYDALNFFPHNTFFNNLGIGNYHSKVFRSLSFLIKSQ
jgi:hypothetical protein